MKKLAILGIVALLLAVALPSAASAWQEGPGTDWYYVDAHYYQQIGPLEIKLDGSPATGQTFYVGDTINITSDVHGYAASCAGWANEAWHEYGLSVSGPSGGGSDSDWAYDYSDSCAEVDTIATATIPSYTLASAGTHTVYMSSYAAVSQYYIDVADELVEGWLTFEVALEVDIDIKPGSDPNSINLRSKGVIPVAILTTPDFDATTVDWTTVRFGPNAASPAHDLSDPLVLADHQRDVDGDGDVDFVLHFRTQDTGIIPSATDATLTGTGIIGTDSVRIVGK